MFVVEGKCGVNLRERKMWILEVYFLRTRAMGELIGHNFNDLRVGADNPRNTLFVDLD
jgi:hypothetical protein